MQAEQVVPQSRVLQVATLPGRRVRFCLFGAALSEPWLVASCSTEMYICFISRGSSGAGTSNGSATLRDQLGLDL